MKKGLFIVVDGMDGSGKSEIVKMLHNYLFSKHKKYRLLTTREPTHGKHGNRIREMLRKEKNPESGSRKLLELFIRDRQDHLKNTIEPFLKSSSISEINIVLCDRYYYSTIAFQSAQGLNTKDIIVLM
ncbi:dTMP kinase [Candidatus Woesearchaeota archaeon]|nr:dTMP kinase [Candidatus Woesearchaeota archaeon]